MTASSPLSASVGRRIHELRVASGFSVDRLAKQAGVRAKVLLSIEGGKARPSVATLDALAKPLHVTVLELVKSATAPGSLVVARLGGGLEQIARAIVDLPPQLGDKLDAVEAAVVERALEECGGNRSAAARLLGMERKALIRRWQRAEREAKRTRRRGV